MKLLDSNAGEALTMSESKPTPQSSNNDGRGDAGIIMIGGRLPKDDPSGL